VIRMISDIIFYEDRSEQNKLLVSEKVVWLLWLSISYICIFI
jgi:hypothetical protein